MTNRTVLFIGALLGLAIPGAVLTLLWFGVAGVLHANATGTDWIKVFWLASVMLVVGWRSTIPRLDDYGIRRRHQLRSLHGNCIRSLATSKAASHVVGLDGASLG